jgi:glutamate racemase
MDERPIGVFDSGLGGLTVVKRLSERLPKEDIVYFGDTGRVPYGTRSKDTIIKYTRLDIAFLLGFNIKAIIIACNTADTAAGETVTTEFQIPIFGVAAPSAKKAALATKNGRIGFIGTRATINSGVYEKAIAAINPKAELKGVACPLFVPLVENGRFMRGDPVIETVAAEYLAPIKEWGADTLILGCTHYPLLIDVISDFLPAVTLINSGSEAAMSVETALRERDMLSEGKEISSSGRGTREYYVSDSAQDFERLGSLFLEGDLGGPVRKIDIESW